MDHVVRRVRATLVGLVLGNMAACGGDGLQRGAVEGRVTLDGVAVEQGVIVFYPTDGTSGPVAGGPIEAGRYAISADRGPVVGRHRVEIRASRNTGRKVPSSPSAPDTLIDEVIEIVPAQYNVRSVLKRDVRRGKNVLDFELPEP